MDTTYSPRELQVALALLNQITTDPGAMKARVMELQAAQATQAKAKELAEERTVLDERRAALARVEDEQRRASASLSEREKLLNAGHQAQAEKSAALNRMADDAKERTTVLEAKAAALALREAKVVAEEQRLEGLHAELQRKHNKLREVLAS